MPLPNEIQATLGYNLGTGITCRSEFDLCKPRITAFAMTETPKTHAFREIEIGPWRVIISARFATAFERLACHVEFERQLDLRALGTPQDAATGRSRNLLIDLPEMPEQLHLRPLNHGGLLARVTEDRFASLNRPLTELEVNASLFQRGAPVAEPACVIARRNGLFWHAAFATVHLENTSDGAAFLNSAPDPQSLERAARSAGSAIRSIHDFGCKHPDLHIKNLMVAEARITVVDLDRASLVATVSARRRMYELMRLRRSLRKRGLAAALSPDVADAFMDAYTCGDSKFRSRLQVHYRRERLRNRAHAWLYPEL